MPEDIVVGFVLVHVAQIYAQQIDEGVPPLHGLDEREQKDVQGMMIENVCLLVKDNLSTVLFVVGFADDDVAQPREGSDVLCVAKDADAVGLVLRPDASAADDASHGKHFAQADEQDGHHADGIEKADDIEPREWPLHISPLTRERGRG